MLVGELPVESRVRDRRVNGTDTVGYISVFKINCLGMGDNEVPCTNKTCRYLSLDLRPGRYQAITRPLPGQ